MADLNEAFNTMKFETKNFHSIEYFFTQRNLKEDHEFLDQNMNRKNKLINIQYNFLAISIPHYDLQDGMCSKIKANIFGDNGYHYNGKIISYQGCTPNFMIPLKGDKKLFVHLIYEQSKENDDNNKNSKDFLSNEYKEFICFIEVPKRFQSIENTSVTNKLKSDAESEIRNNTVVI